MRRPSPQRWLLVSAVMLLHLGLLSMLLKVRPVVRQPPDRTASQPPPLWLRLLNAPTAQAPAAESRRLPPSTVARTDTPRSAAQAITRPSSPSGAEPTPSATTGPATLPAAVAMSSAAFPPAPASVPASSPLNLALPPPTKREALSPAAQLRQDPRFQVQPLDRDGRLREALGYDGPVTSETLADGSIRLRRGSDCALARPSQAQTLDPFNQSTHPLPRSVDSCR